MYSVVLVILSITSKMCYSYVYYPKLEKHCIMTQCPPGTEIHPCHDEFTNDTCSPCSKGLVQPDTIISTGDLAISSCFKPAGDCLANDITHSRIKGKAFCDSLQGCKCDTTKCYHGDPCLCTKHDPCDKGQYLNDKGECIACPEGTIKDHIGCGPCKLNGTSNSKANIVPIKYTTTPPKPTTEISTDYNGRNPDKFGAPHQSRITDTNDNKVLIICIAVLGAVVVILMLVILWVCTRRPELVRWVCWTTGPTNLQPHDLENNIVPECERLVQQNHEKAPNGRIDAKNNNGPTPKANPVDEKNAEVYRHNSNVEPGDRCSSSTSGIEEDDGTTLDDTQHSWSDNDHVFESDTDKHSIDEMKSSTGSMESVNKRKLIDGKPSLELQTLIMNNNYRLSESKSPVTTESEPAYLRSRSADHSVHFNFMKNSPHTDLASGSYISMNHSGKTESRCVTEDLPSNLETLKIPLTGFPTNGESIQCSKDNSIDTKAKHCGPVSYNSGDGDSGIHMT